MRYLQALVAYLSSSTVLTAAAEHECRCIPGDGCWPSLSEWDLLNATLSGALIKASPPASVCYPTRPNYDEGNCAIVRSQWSNSTWHADNPISIDYPVWANNSCDPIYPNGTSVTGDVNAGAKGCTIGDYPVYVVNATTADHVSTALKWAGQKNVRIVVKNTGHSYQGRSVGFGSLSIWTHHFRGVEYLPKFSPIGSSGNESYTAARMAAGTTGVEAISALAPYNAVAVVGGNPDVGLMGWMQGGGHGTLSSTYGLGANNLLEATMVVTNGTVLTVSPYQHADLFSAIRGGGAGTFGVVLEAIVRTYPSPQTTVHNFSFAARNANASSQYWNMIGFLHSELPRLKAVGMQGYYYILGPPVYPTLAFTWYFMLYDKPEGTIDRLMEPIEARLNASAAALAYTSNSATVPTFWDIEKVTSNEAVASGGGAYGSRLLSPESLADPNRTAEVFKRIGPSADASRPNGISTNPVLIGHMIAPTSPPTYQPDASFLNPAWYRTLVHFVVVEQWQDGIPQPLIDSVYQDITWNKTQPLRQLSPDTGAYFNEGDSFEPQWQNAFWGDRYGKLLDVKRKWDPEGLLWCDRCVGSEAWRVDEGGRLCRVHDGGYGKRNVGSEHENWGADWPGKAENA